jgi:hypothetical protein
MQAARTLTLPQHQNVQTRLISSFLLWECKHEMKYTIIRMSGFHPENTFRDPHHLPPYGSCNLEACIYSRKIMYMMHFNLTVLQVTRARARGVEEKKDFRSTILRKSVLKIVEYRLL